VTRVKICGLTKLEDALAAAAAGADAIGLNFAEEAKSRGRYVAPGAAREIARRLPPFVSTVAICVDDPLERLREYLAFVDYVQLCGDESRWVCEALYPRAIKAFRVGPGFRIPEMLTYRAGAYLLDAHVAGKHGGTGVTCDWRTARQVRDLGVPVMLAGGLTPDNVAGAVQAVRPYAVDTAGGVESAPGKKDHERIRRFIRNAKRAL
jgi:phosphoribosylanthranilate isomerase